jgi:sarcosine oxidase, subunit alpha
MGGAPTRWFRYRGRPTEARDGETLLAAVSRDGLPVVERSLRYHRPRAPFCGLGQCTGCLVRVNGDPIVRSCRYRPADGDRVEGTRGWPSARWDLLGLLDGLFPQGIDPFRAFRRPAFLVPVYQRVVRRLSGYGPPPPDPPPAVPPAPPFPPTVPVAIVGAGRSGRAVAHRLVSRGISPLVIEREPDAADVPGAELRRGASVTFLTPPGPEPAFPFTLLGAGDSGSGFAVRARAVVVATGGYDASLFFGGNDRPGVLTADAVMALSPAQQRSWFRRAAVVGGGRRAHAVLARFGPQVAAVVAPGEIRPEVVRAASDLGIPLYPRSLVLGARGRARVRGLDLRARGEGPRFSLACDAVVLAHRRLPNMPLLPLAGARLAWLGEAGAYYPVLDPNGATSVPGLYAVGEVAGERNDLEDSSAERVAAAIAGHAPDRPPSLARVRAAGPGELEGYYRELLREPRPGRWIACRCEDVLYREVEAATARGYRGVEVVKRYTALGTGLCQGRYCLPDAVLLLSILEGRPPAEVGTITPRPPVFPTPLRALAELDASIVAEGA